MGTFWCDRAPVTNAAFRRFVAATGFTTVAERTPTAAELPGAASGELRAGSLVFRETEGPVPLDDWRRWWAYVAGADWRHPDGPGSSLRGRGKHPVVHIAWEDASAYAAWAGKRLPSEAEWEHAARGGLVGARYPWGDEFAPGGQAMANVWEGEFPWRHRRSRGGTTTPVASYPPNGYGLHDACGNVWEWTASDWTENHSDDDGCRCAPGGKGAGRRVVIKGGSHLCAPSYCHRYRPAARQGQEVRSSTSHIGFRCVADLPPGLR